MNKKLRIKVVRNCVGSWWFGVYENRKMLMDLPKGKYWKTEDAAIRNAKAMAERIGIPYDPEIIQQHGC